MNSLTASFAARLSSAAAYFPAWSRVPQRAFFVQPPVRRCRSGRIVCSAEPYLISKLESAEKTWKELSVYMTYVQALYGGGGWPLSVFLSPDLRPLMGGTYFPPDDKYGRPGFKTVLRKIKEAWDTKKESLVKSGAFAIEQLSEALAAVATSEKLPDGLPERAVQKCAEQFADSYDSKFGGFGSAPKFPRPVEIQVMLYHKKKLKDNQMRGEATFTISYLTKSCGLSLNDAFSVSKKLCINSRENSDAVLQLLKRYGFTKVQISRLITKWPSVLQSCAEKTLSPKLEFFRSIGVPAAVLPQKLSEYPFLLRRSFANYFTPWYNYLKSIVQSDKNIVAVFLSSPMAFTHGWPERVPSNILILRERGVPESSIASLMLNKPSMMILKKEKFSAYVDRAIELGFRESKFVFVRALQLFGSMSESTLKHKMDVYRRCGWSESDLTAALLRHPICMKLSQKKIRANMDFLVNELGFNPSDVAQCPAILDYNCDRRMKQRWNVVRMLKARGLMKKSIRITSLFHMSETNFLKRCIANHEEEFPELLDIYRGTMSAPQIGFNENVISK